MNASRSNKCEAQRLKIGNFDKTIIVRRADKSAVFEMELPTGETSMKRWLLDAENKQLFGAYYVDVERRGPQ